MIGSLGKLLYNHPPPSSPSFPSAMERWNKEKLKIFLCKPACDLSGMTHRGENNTSTTFPEALSPAFIHAGTDLWPHPLSFNAEQLQQLQQQALLHHASIQHQLPVRSFLWLQDQDQAWTGALLLLTYPCKSHISTAKKIQKLLAFIDKKGF